MRHRPPSIPTLPLLLALLVGIAVAERMRIAFWPYGEMETFLLDVRLWAVLVALLVMALVLLLTMRVTPRTRLMRHVLQPALGFAMGCLLMRVDCSNAFKGTIPLPDLSLLYDVMAGVRVELLNIYARLGMPQEEEAIVAAMTLGERGGVDSALRAAYNVSGAAHVFALSGLHLSIVVGILYYIIPRGLPQGWRIAMVLTFTWLFVLLVGCNASVVRAAVMMSVYLPSRALSDRGGGLDALLFAAMLLLMLKPSWLYDVGFQMSFAAVAGILTFYPLLTYRTTEVSSGWDEIYLYADEDGKLPLARRVMTSLREACGRLLWRIWRVTAVALSAQIGVAPLLMLYFHRFSPYFLLSSYVVSLMAFVIIALALVVLVVGVLHSLMGVVWAVAASVVGGILHLMAYVLSAMVRILNVAMVWLSHLPYANVDGININATQTIVIYVALMLMAYVLYHYSLRRAA